MTKCDLCKKELKDNELYCYFDDTSSKYTTDKYYCKECYKKKYPNDSRDISDNQTYKDFLSENLDYFFRKEK